MEEGNQQHLQPLLHTTTKYSAVQSSSSTSSADSDTLSIKAIDVSIWANYEASKGFDITIANEARDTPSGKRFALFYVSNGRISRLVINTSKFVEDILYPDESYPKKQVNHVVVRLASRNLTDNVIVDSPNGNEFVLHISPSVMEEINFSHAMFLAMQQGIARIWLWDGQGNAPRSLVNGMVKYISDLALSNEMLSSGDVELPLPKTFCWKNKDARAVAQFLNYCEDHNQGFIRRLNQAMKDDWRDQMLDDTLGMPAQNFCASYRSSSLMHRKY